MIQTTEKSRFTLGRQSYEELASQVKESMGDDIRVEDIVYREGDEWCVDIHHAVVITEEEDEKRAIKQYKVIDDDKFVPFKEQKETISFAVQPLVLFGWFTESAGSVDELPDPNSLSGEERATAQELYEQRKKELEAIPMIDSTDEQLEETPFCIKLSDDMGTLLVLDSKQICPDCGKFSISSRMSYVWIGTKDPDLLELGYGASVKHYFTECSHCSYGMYG